MSDSTRREFLKVAGAAVAGGLLPRSGRGATLAAGVRKDVTSLTPAELKDYRDAVTAMRALPAVNKLSWAFQAGIHRDSCPHGNWFFLPWHRAYLFYFEQACRKALGKADFMLPYWNWTTTRTIPAGFWGQGNALNDSTRDIGPNGPAIDDEFVGQQVIDAIMAIPDFLTFGSGKASKLRPTPSFRRDGQLEAVPHNNVHGILGGNMGSVPTSAQDPIFWLHHANIDRIWAEWARTHANPNDAVWLNLSLDFFSPDGAPAAKKVSEVLDTQVLGYRYDTQPAAIHVAAHAPLPLLTSADIAPGLKASVAGPPGGAWVPQIPTVAATLPAELKSRLGEFPANPEAQRPVTFRLKLDGLRPPPNQMAVAIRVFLNCDYVSPTTKIGDPHYVGTFSFFGGHGEGAGHEGGDTAFYLDATKCVRRLYGGRGYNENDVRISLVCISLKTGKALDQHPTAKRYELAAVPAGPEV